MKKLLCFIGLFPALFALKSHANIPGGTIPFIFDSHLYLQVRLNDTIPVTVIYDTGADFLYLDEDYLKRNNLQNAFGKKGTARTIYCFSDLLERKVTRLHALVLFSSR